MTHFAAMQKAVEMSSESSTLAKDLLAAEDGFVDAAGVFLTREEAFERAAANKQLKNVAQSEPEENKRFYGGKKPRLDSGIIENYCPLV